MTHYIYAFLNKTRLGQTFPFAMIAIALGVALYTLWLLVGDFDTHAQRVDDLINMNGVLLAVVSVMLLFRYYRIFSQSKNGYGLQHRIIRLFSVLALVPTILITIFALAFFNLGLKSWFSERVSSALHSSRVVANAYLQEHRKTIATDAFSIARIVDAEFPQLDLNQDELEKTLLNQGILRDLTEILLFDTVGRIYGRYGLTAALELEPVSYEDLLRADQGEAVLYSDTELQRVRTLIRLSRNDTYMIIGRFVDPKVIGYIDKTNMALSGYETLEQSSEEIQLSFTFVFILVVLILLIVAIWMGLGIAQTLINPIRELIYATQNIIQGEYEKRVHIHTEYSEVRHLIESFNNMAETVFDTTQGLKQANQDILDRSQFIETLLADIKTGIISTDIHGHILLLNSYGADLLQYSESDVIGLSITDIVPEFDSIIAYVRENKTPYVGDVMYGKGLQKRKYIVRISLEFTPDKILERLMVSFDDITDVERTQKQLVWADVARRMAHEIKNPLTPIQLSAERLKRRYAEVVEHGDEVFSSCTDTIIRQVEEIGRMVDEFNGFARMPVANMIQDNFADTVKSAYLLQKNAHTHVEYELDCPPALMWTHDRHHISQVVNNVMKNALDVLMEKHIKNPKIKVVVKADKTCLYLDIHDNGQGFPDDDRESLFEPYVTNHKNGTGLGLSIVKKIVEDHGGTIALLDSGFLGGAWVHIMLPVIDTSKIHINTIDEG